MCQPLNRLNVGKPRIQTKRSRSYLWSFEMPSGVLLWQNECKPRQRCNKLRQYLLCLPGHLPKHHPRRLEWHLEVLRIVIRHFRHCFLHPICLYWRVFLTQSNPRCYQLFLLKDAWVLSKTISGRERTQKKVAPTHCQTRKGWRIKWRAWLCSRGRRIGWKETRNWANWVLHR